MPSNLLEAPTLQARASPWWSLHPLTPKHSTPPPHPAWNIIIAKPCLQTGQCLIAILDTSWYLAQTLQSDIDWQAFILACVAWTAQLLTVLTDANDIQADIAYYPFMERFDVAMPEFCNYSIRSEENSEIRAWMTAMENRESAQIAGPDAALLLQAFKYASTLSYSDVGKCYSSIYLKPACAARAMLSWST